MKNCNHDWIEEYYGYRCKLCDLFIPYGCEPWMPTDEEIHEMILATHSSKEAKSDEEDR